jgi:hypothetical protein
MISAGRADCWARAKAALQSMPRQPMRASTWPMGDGATERDSGEGQGEGSDEGEGKGEVWG